MMSLPRRLGRTLLSVEPGRYSIGAVVCALLNNVIFIAGADFGWGYGAMISMSWGLTGTIGYAIHTRHTFGLRAGAGGYARFMLGVALGIPAAYLCLWLFHGLIGLPMWWAAPVITLVMLLYNYAVARIAITRRLFGEIPTKGVM